MMIHQWQFEKYAEGYPWLVLCDWGSPSHWVEKRCNLNWTENWKKKKQKTCVCVCYLTKHRPAPQ